MTKVWINNKLVSNVVSGYVLSDELNETLDSGILKLNNVNKIELKPYDEIKINGRRYLLDNYNESYNKATNKYNYIINMMSETKGLEVIQLPNISITQPLNKDKKISVWTYLQRFLTQYNPQIKVVSSGENWVYQGKYTLDPNLESIFGKVYAPDFSLNNPNLRDLFSHLMITRDRIPTVQDNVIGCLDLTTRNGVFNTNNLTDIQRSMDSENYAQNLKKSYTGALSQDNAIRLIEKMGFRNSDDALLTLENMRLETRFPIYKINRVLMCYYKRIKVSAIEGGTTTNAMFLCKQDITKLVLPNEARNLLSKDWKDFETNIPSSVDELAEYRLATLGYEIGSNFIEGWGTSYSYPSGWWHTTEKTYIENIVRVMDAIYPLGINSYNIIRDALNKGTIIEPYSSTDYHQNIISPFSDDSAEGALKFKGLFFEIDYNGFYGGTLVHSKDNDFGSITINDNPSSSLTLLESDGIFQKEKINRLGNEIVALSANYTSESEIQPLGSVFDNDIVIFKRDISYSANNNIKVNYYGSKDYVMKNYFTSVYSKHRTTNLIPYGESIVRAENKKVFMFLSKTDYIVDNTALNFNFQYFTNIEFDILSAFRPSEILTSKDDFKNSHKINLGFFYKGGKAYLSDIARFVSGNSIGFNIRMYDNVSGGVYIKTKEAGEDGTVGSEQAWHLLVDDIETGYIESLGVYFGHIDAQTQFAEMPLEYFRSIVIDAYDRMFNLPEQNISLTSSKNLMGGNLLVNKDNKEVLDYTFQIETITDDDNIIFTPLFMGMSDLIGNYHKVEQDYSVSDIKGGGFIEQVYASSFAEMISGNRIPYITLQLNVPHTYETNLNVNDRVEFIATWDFKQDMGAKIIAEQITGLEAIMSGDQVIGMGKITIRVKVLWRDVYGTWYNRGQKYLTFKRVGNYFTESENPLFYNQPHRDGTTSSFGVRVLCEDLVNIIDADFNNDKFGGYSNPSTANCDFESATFIVSELDNITTTYAQNMYVVFRTEHIKKHATTEQLTDLDIDFDMNTGKKYAVDSDVKVSDIFKYEIHKGKPCIKVITDDMIFQMLLYYATVELWYKDKDNNYKMVFGVNITVQDRLNLFIRIYISLLNNGDFRVFNENGDLVGQVKKLQPNENNDNLQKYRII